MKTMKSKAAVAIVLTAFLGSACSQKIEQFKPAYSAPHQNEVTVQEFSHFVNFNGSSESLSEDEKDALDYFLYTQGVGYGDILMVDVYADDPAWGAKMDAINAFLKTRGFWAKQAVQTGGVSDASAAALVVSRYNVTPPDCLAISKEAFVVNSDQKVPLFGCINAHNLGVQVASPRDLLEGQPDALAEPYGASRAIQLYRENYGGAEDDQSAGESLIEALFGGG